MSLDRDQVKIIVPERGDLEQVARLLHQQVEEQYMPGKPSASIIVDGLTDILQVCAEYQRNLMLRSHQIDNPPDRGYSRRHTDR